MSTLTTSVPALLLLGAVLIPAAVYLLLGLGERVLTLAGFGTSRRLRPWLWLFVPLLLIAVVLVYPLLRTVVLAFAGPDGHGWVGLRNLGWVFSGELLGVLGNNLVWLVVFPLLTLVLALVVAVCFDRVRYERVAMTLIVLPTAISFTAGSIVWRQIYSYQPEGTPTRGLLNALWTLLPGARPVAWLQTPLVNTLALIVVAVWAGLGVAALILSAAVKSVPAELLEAARLDGAGEVRNFFAIVLPSIAPAVLVVVTTEVIFALKIFDIVYVMTNGNYGTDTLANSMYRELFAVNDFGHASAIAVVLLVLALPVVVVNIRQFRAEEVSR